MSSVNWKSWRNEMDDILNHMLDVSNHVGVVHLAQQIKNVRNDLVNALNRHLQPDVVMKYVDTLLKLYQIGLNLLKSHVVARQVSYWEQRRRLLLLLTEGGYL